MSEPIYARRERCRELSDEDLALWAGGLLYSGAAALRRNDPLAAEMRGMAAELAERFFYSKIRPRWHVTSTSTGGLISSAHFVATASTVAAAVPLARGPGP